MVFGWVRGWMWVAGAMAQAPVTYEEALRSSVDRNVQLASALAAQKQAESSLLAARGLFAHPDVSAFTARLDQHLDPEEFKAVLGVQ